MDKARAPLRISQSIQSTNAKHNSQIYLLLRKFNTNIRGMVYPTPSYDYLFIINDNLGGETKKEVYFKLLNKLKDKDHHLKKVFIIK